MFLQEKSTQIPMRNTVLGSRRNLPSTSVTQKKFANAQEGWAMIKLTPVKIVANGSKLRPAEVTRLCAARRGTEQVEMPVGENVY